MNGTTTAQLAEKTAKAVTGSVEEWTGFLQSAARLYKYSYPAVDLRPASGCDRLCQL